MKKIIYFATIIFIILNFSCKKETIIKQGCISNYLPLNIGNYWVYEHFKVDSLGNDSSINKFDSLYINRDTIVNGKTYFVYEGSYHPFSYNFFQLYRDSSGFLLEPNGKSYLSYNNFSDTIDIVNSGNNTIYITLEKLDNVSVPVGIYNNCISINQYNNISYNGVNNVIKNVFVYSKDIGNLLSTYSFAGSSNSYHFERRLIKFHIEP